VCVCVCALAFKCLELVRFVLLISQKNPEKKGDIVKHCYKLKLLLYFHVTFLMKCIRGITPVFSVMILCKNHSILGFFFFSGYFDE